MKSRKAADRDDRFGPVEKVRILALAAGLSDLSRVQLAVLNVITDMVNSKTHIAWPSYKTLVERTGASRKAVVTAVQKLIQRDPPLLLIVEPGNRVRSNRYAINRRYFSDLETKIGGVPGDTTLVNSATLGGVVQNTTVVSPATLESIHESEQQAKDEMNNGAEPVCPVAGATGSPQTKMSGIRYPEFWEVMNRRNVANAEQLITEFVAEGVLYGAIVDGAHRYRDWCKANGGTMLMAPDSWLLKKKWLDGWFTPKASEVQKLIAKLKKGKKSIYRKSRAYVEFDRFQDRLPPRLQRDRANRSFDRHLETCLTCKQEYSHDSKSLDCPLGNGLIQDRRIASTLDSLSDKHWDWDWYQWSYELDDWENIDTSTDEGDRLSDDLTDQKPKLIPFIVPDAWVDEEPDDDGVVSHLDIEIRVYSTDHFEWNKRRFALRDDSEALEAFKLQNPEPELTVIYEPG